MKTFKKSKRLLPVIFLTICLFLASCKKSGDNNITPVKTSDTPGFSYGGTPYNGTWISVNDVGAGGALGNIDVALTVTVGNNTYDFIVYNMPMQSSGTYTFTNGSANLKGSQLYALALLGSPPVAYASTGGTIIKTGANSFTFSCPMVLVGSNTNITVTGQGSY
jgi:hypothetical protein